MSRLWIVLGIVACVLMGTVDTGCFQMPDYLNALIVSTDTLDFGYTLDTMTFTVAKVWSSRTMPPFTLSADKEWVSVSPTSGETTSPFDPVTITVTVDRLKMAFGDATAIITMAAEGVVPATVKVIAKVGLKADFTADNTLTYIGDPVQFIDQTTEPIGQKQQKEVVSWTWDFGDGTTGPERSERNPVHVYNGEGQFTVSLTAANSAGVTHTRTKENYITVFAKTPPTADFTAVNPVAVSGQPVQLRDLSNPGSKPIDTWAWDFGDTSQGPERSLQNPAHIYAAAAQYEAKYPVSLAVTTAHGSDTEMKPDYVTIFTMSVPHGAGSGAAPESPVETPDAAFGVDYPWDANFKWFVTGQEVVFKDSSHVDGNTATYLWEFGDGASSTERSPRHAYAQAGVYTPRLTVTNGSGTDTAEYVGGIHVFTATPLDEYVRRTDTGYEPGLPPASTIDTPFCTTYMVIMTSQVWNSDSAPSEPQTLRHEMLVVVPNGVKWNAALLIVANEPDSPASELALAGAALSSKAVVAVLHRAPNQPPLFVPSVASVARAMDTIQQLTKGKAEIANFVVAGANEDGWTAWLTAATDQRVRAVAAVGVDAVNTQGQSLADIPDLGVYEPRVQIPLVSVDESGGDVLLPETGAFHIDRNVLEQYLQTP